MGLYLHLGCWKLTNAALSQQRSKKDNLNKRLFLFSFFFKQIIWGFRTTRIPNIQEETDVVKERQRVAKHWNRKRKSKKHSVRENRQHSWVDRGFQHREGNYKKAETKDSKLKYIYIYQIWRIPLMDSSTEEIYIQGEDLWMVPQKEITKMKTHKGETSETKTEHLRTMWQFSENVERHWPQTLKI